MEVSRRKLLGLLPAIPLLALVPAVKAETPESIAGQVVRMYKVMGYDDSGHGPYIDHEDVSKRLGSPEEISAAFDMLMQHVEWLRETGQFGRMRS